ncbi:MAG: hypothetical protein ACK5Z5_02225, partial [Neisseriaceae bacterium]
MNIQRIRPYTTHSKQIQKDHEEKHDLISNYDMDSQKQDLDADYYNKNSKVQKQLAYGLLEYYNI